MAGDIKTRAVDELAETVNIATSEANRTMLRLATEAVVKPGKAKRASRITHLARLFDQAADHLAEAHKTLFSDPDKTETAIAHLDAALDCLRQVTVDRPVQPKEDEAERARSA